MSSDFRIHGLDHVQLAMPAGTRASLHRAGRWAMLGVIALAMASCARHYRLDTPADMSDLPVRRGWTGFNVVAQTPWRYMGSHYATHEFRYYFNRDNALHFRDVSVARERTVLNFEEKPVGRTKKHWVTLQTDGQTFYFSLLPRH
jgi:hypothetical protein